jgi:hypothetical protein
LLLQKGQNDRIREHFMDQCVYESRQFWWWKCYGLDWNLSWCTQLKIVQGTLNAIKYRDDILDIWTFARPGALQEVSSAVIILFRRWIRCKCLSWRCGVTCGLSLRGLSFVLPVCRRRITSLEMVIL